MLNINGADLGIAIPNNALIKFGHQNKIITGYVK
jgi:hypothetical protein